MAKRARAKDVAQDRGAGVFFIDHAEILEEDYELLKSAERLTLWNVRVPAGFLARAVLALQVQARRAEILDIRFVFRVGVLPATSISSLALTSFSTLLSIKFEGCATCR
jgi:predicted exporter